MIKFVGLRPTCLGLGRQRFKVIVRLVSGFVVAINILSLYGAN